MFNYPHHRRLLMTPELRLALNEFMDHAGWVAALPFAVGALRFKQSGYGLKAIAILSLVALITDITLSNYQNAEPFSLYVPRVYTLIEFSLLTTFFISITSRKRLRVGMLIMLVPFSAVVVVDYLISNLKQRDELALVTGSLLLIIYSLLTLYNILRDAEYPNILATPQFWVISAVLVYFGGNIFVFISDNYAARLSYDSMMLIWSLHAAIGMIFYSLLAIGLWKTKQFR